MELVVPLNPPATPSDEEIIARLHPDRAKFVPEEQRRFEVLTALVALAEAGQTRLTDTMLAV